MRIESLKPSIDNVPSLNEPVRSWTVGQLLTVTVIGKVRETLFALYQQVWMATPP